MAAIRFELTSVMAPPDLEVRVLVDDVDLVDLVAAFENEHGFEPAGGYGGLMPSRYSFGPMREHFLARSTMAREGSIPVLGCNCGEWGCWPLEASVVVGDERVEWSQFTQPHRPQWDYAGFGPFTFLRADYEHAVDDLEEQLAASRPEGP